jgi:periplasmic protein TonB
MSVASPELKSRPSLPDVESASNTPTFRTRADPLSLLSVCTFVLWLGCVVVGVLGHSMPYARPQADAPPPPPVQAEILPVELVNDPLPPPDITPPLVVPSPRLPEPDALPPTPPAPPLIAVAEPTAATAFALPVEGPVRIVTTKESESPQATSPVAPVPSLTPPVQAIKFGEGEGKQPAPDYPRRAVREGQEGSVEVRFSVGENGRVLAAEASSRSPWPLLNDAALRVVRERWRFRPGAIRLYQVSIRFELTK